MIEYEAGYKYQLYRAYMVQTGIRSDTAVIHDFITLTPSGILVISKGYAWDGCSGPTKDTKANMRAGLIHDACYQLMREGLLNIKWRDTVDDEFREHIEEDSPKVEHPWGLGWWQYVDKFRAKYYYAGVHAFGEDFAKQQAEVVLTAP